MRHALPDVAAGGALLVGSVPLRDADEVFRTASVALGARLRRIPDGETGPRSDWIVWQYPVLSSRPELEVCPPGPHPYQLLPRLRLTDEGSAESLRLDDLGYAHAALSSYRLFARLKRDGRIPAHCRFQVSLPTPLSPISAFVAPEHQAIVEPVYERVLLAELRTILDAIPHDQLAIQWDTNFEFAMLDGLLPAWFSDVRGGIVDRLLRLAAQVPEPVELGYHFCQDHERRHHDRPYDARRMVEVANALGGGLGRSLTWLHLPVPADRLDVVFFEKLAPLALPASTEPLPRPHPPGRGPDGRVGPAHRGAALPGWLRRRDGMWLGPAPPPGRRPAPGPPRGVRGTARRTRPRAIPPGPDWLAAVRFDSLEHRLDHGGSTYLGGTSTTATDQRRKR